MKNMEKAGSEDIPIRVGISQCLLGDPVRYDAGHKLDRYLRDTLGMFVQWVPVCPEVECGLPTPRESMHLVGSPDNPRLLTTRSRIDQTGRMQGWIAMRIPQLAGERLCGFVFKTRSPSSGMRDIKIYDETGKNVRHRGAGLFARAFMENFPLIPVEDEGRLNDMGLRENFIERVFVFARWQYYEETDGSPKGLIEFHTDHKLLIMAHSPKDLKTLGALVAKVKAIPPETLRREYITTLMAALRLKATPRKNTNVLDHCKGYFKKQLSAGEKEELREVIDDYHAGLIPLIVPVTLIRHYTRLYGEPYLMRQKYLNPHPRELMLRNHV